MEKLIYAEDLKSGDRFKYLDMPEMTCDGGTRPETAECDGCKCQTIKKLRINVPGGAITIPNDPKAVVTLLHRPYSEGRTEKDTLVLIAALAQRSAEILDNSSSQDTADHLADPDGMLAPLRDILEAYFLAKPEGDLATMTIVCPPYPLDHRA